MDKMNELKEYWEQRLGTNWGLHGVGYIGYGSYYNNWLYKIREKVFRREIKELLDERALLDAKVLDVGSGTGFYVNLFRELGVRNLIGTDLTQTAIDRLRQTFDNGIFRQLDIGSDVDLQDFAEKDFDLITAFDVFFHITDENNYVKAISNIALLLKAGGYFIFSENFIRFSRISQNHQVSRTLDQIINYLQSAQLIPVKRIPIFAVMNTPVDTKYKWVISLWRMFFAPLRIMNRLGNIYGAALYPLELFILRYLKEGPSTEMMICKKQI